MKSPILFLAAGLFFSTACNTQTAEDAAKDYLTESLNDFKEQLPLDLAGFDSLLLDSTVLKKKIEETTNLDSLAKYNELLKDAKNLIKKDISGLDSIDHEIRQIIDYNP